MRLTPEIRSYLDHFTRWIQNPTPDNFEWRIDALERMLGRDPLGGTP